MVAKLILIKASSHGPSFKSEQLNVDFTSKKPEGELMYRSAVESLNDFLEDYKNDPWDTKNKSRIRITEEKSLVKDYDSALDLNQILSEDYEPPMWLGRPTMLASPHSLWECATDFSVDLYFQRVQKGHTRKRIVETLNEALNGFGGFQESLFQESTKELISRQLRIGEEITKYPYSLPKEIVGNFD